MHDPAFNTSIPDLAKIAEVTTFGKSKILADDWIGQAKELQQAKLF